MVLTLRKSASVRIKGKVRSELRRLVVSCFAEKKTELKSELADLGYEWPRDKDDIGLHLDCPCRY